MKTATSTRNMTPKELNKALENIFEKSARPDMDASNADTLKIHAIAKRAVNMTLVQLSLLDLSMDITAAHLNGNPLDLDGLLKAKDNDFWHDIAGINSNLDRETGKLANCFRPRYSAR